MFIEILSPYMWFYFITFFIFCLVIHTWEYLFIWIENFRFGTHHDRLRWRRLQHTNVCCVFVSCIFWDLNYLLNNFIVSMNCINIQQHMCKMCVYEKNKIRISMFLLLNQSVVKKKSIFCERAFLFVAFSLAWLVE